MITQYFAHAGEQHATAAETSTHYLQEWYFAVPLLLIVVALFGGFMYFVSKRSKPITFMSIVGVLLIIGVGGYTVSPIMSIVALSVGLAMILLTVLVALMPRSSESKKDKTSS